MSGSAMAKEPQLTLRALLSGIAEAPALPLRGLSADSRTLAAGEAFVACSGSAHHGVEFVPDALARGAAAILWDSETTTEEPVTGDVPSIPVPGLAGRLGDIANRYYGSPSERLQVSGITGTNGKTTVAWLIAGCLRRLGRPTAYLGTLGSGLDGMPSGSSLTTPACLDLHRELADFYGRGARHVVMEVSSHALAQQRTAGVAFDSVVFTNLSRDHIDYHGDMQRYGETKARLIQDPAARHRIVNVDDAFGRTLAERCRGSVTRVSTGPIDSGAGERHLVLQVTDRDERGIGTRIAGSWGESPCRLPLVGAFNVSNAALALAQLLHWDIALADAVGALEVAAAPPGRLQRVEAKAAGDAPAVYVDYAHTPAGLEAVLEALREHCPGRLWCVFGCGGDRDRGKREPMGRAVSRLADRAVVTNDNPRHESPASIIADILDGMDGDVTAIEDRAVAIAYAIRNAGPEDVVLVAGKGHENYQVIGDRRLPFSDAEWAAAQLAASYPRGGRR